MELIMPFIVTTEDTLYLSSSLNTTEHATQRLEQRGISKKQMMLAFKYGRVIHSRRAVYHVVGKKEIAMYSHIEPELKNMDGIQLVMSSDDTVLTVYRNKDLRKIRPYKHNHKHLH